MCEDNIAIILNALADKIRMLQWENKRLQERNEALIALIPPEKAEEITPF